MRKIARVAPTRDPPGPVAHVDCNPHTGVPTVQPTTGNVLTRDAVPIGISIREPSVERFPQLSHEYLVGRAETNAARQMLVEASPHRLVSVIE